MKVGLITSWKEKCGIAEYSKNLIESLRRLGTDLFVYEMDSIWDLKAFSDFVRADVVNFQYEHGLFGQTELHEWVTRFTSLINHPKLFITAHQVLKDDLWDGLYDMINGMIVHSDRFGPILKDKTYVIPHGCPVYKSTDKREVRKELGWKTDVPLLSTFGFMFPHKGWENIIQAMPRIQEKYPDCKLLMVCSHFRDKSKTEPTAKAMKKYVKKMKANVKFFHDRWDVSEFMPLLQASDIFITSQETVDRLIASGSALMGISARRPTITNDCSIYSQVQPYAYVINRRRADRIAEGVLDLLSSETLYNEYCSKAEEAYQKFNWNSIAKQHLALYTKAF